MRGRVLQLVLILALLGCTKGGGSGGSAGGAKTDASPTCRASGGDAYANVDKIVAAPDDFLPCREVKAHGYVVAASIQAQIVDQTVVRTFELSMLGKNLRVAHRGVVPDTFKDNAETVVSGTLVREGTTLELRAHDGADGIAAKCPSRYEAPQ